MHLSQENNAPRMPMSTGRVFRLSGGGATMRDRLRLNRLDENQKGPARTGPQRDAIPFPGAADDQVVSPLTPAPFRAWRPRDGQDTIASVESALEHAERQLANLRALLGEDAPDSSDPRAA